MLRRLATLLLTLCVTFAGLLAQPHAAACCVVRQAPAHDCCKVPVQLKTSDCCRGSQQLSDRAVHNHHAPQQGLPVALTAPLVAVSPLAVRAVGDVPLTRGLAPPGSLIAQHTSLLL
jgi:hypothetical protein